VSEKYEVDIAIAKFKSILRAQAELNKKKAELERYVSRMTKDDRHSYVKATLEY